MMFFSSQRLKTPRDYLLIGMLFYLYLLRLNLATDHRCRGNTLHSHGH